MRLYAHTDQEGSLDNGQPLVNHLEAVAEKCSVFAKSFGYEHWGYALGLLHDAGKASEQFQKRLAGSSMQVDHATAGAQLCAQEYAGDSAQKMASILMSLAIAGHHGGMPNVQELGRRTPLDQRLGKDVPEYLDAYLEALASAGITLPSKDELEPLPPLRSDRNLPEGLTMGDDAFIACASFSVQLLGRLLFSCLVDADYLDTERFVSPEVAKMRKHEYASIDELLCRLDDRLGELQSNAPNTPVNSARSQILADCVEAAEWNPGLFTLSVPTGGGKTLSSMEFALRHAALHGKTRVIYAIPFTSVVQQTAAVFRSVFGRENVLEHHSAHALVTFDDAHEGESNESAKAERLATQNWDAPIVVTTNVQLLESLYSNRPSKCRKLHNIVNSVIVLDEAQTLPDSLLASTLAVLEGLCIDFSTSVVLCTATQPALDNLWPFSSRPREISRTRDSFENAFSRRVRFEPVVATTQEVLAKELCDKRQVLCVVGTKNKARELYLEVIQAARKKGTLAYDADPAQEGYYHLSTNMVSAHRTSVLEEICQRLSENRRCVVISTQLIEAGVDVDFAEAYREIAGIDSLMQVAGRCNREGRLQDDEGNLCPGIVHIFEYEEDLKPESSSLVRSWLGAMKNISRALLKENGGVVSDSLVKPYFSTRYMTNADKLDRGSVFADISQALGNRCQTLKYESYADKYEIIDDVTEAVYVPWDDEGRRLLGIAAKLAATGEEAALFMPLQRYAVGVYNHVLKELVESGAIEEVGKYHALTQDALITRYSKETGLLPTSEDEINNLII